MSAVSVPVKDWMPTATCSGPIASVKLRSSAPVIASPFQ